MLLSGFSSPLNRWRVVAGAASEQGYYTIGPLICS